MKIMNSNLGSLHKDNMVPKWKFYLNFGDDIKQIKTTQRYVLNYRLFKTNSKLPAERVQFHRLLNPGVNISPTLSHKMETGPKKKCYNYFSLDMTIISTFSRNHKDDVIPRTIGRNFKNRTPTFPFTMYVYHNLVSVFAN